MGFRSDDPAVEGIGIAMVLGVVVFLAWLAWTIVGAVFDKLA